MSIGVTTSAGLPAVMKTLPRAPGRAAEPLIKSGQVRSRAETAQREVQQVPTPTLYPVTEHYFVVFLKE